MKMKQPGIAYLKHCTPDYNGKTALVKILESGILNASGEFGTQVFLQMVFDGTWSANYSMVCLKINKQILRKYDFHVTSRWNYGKHDDSTIKKRDLTLENFSKINKQVNEVVFDGPLDINGYISGVVFMVTVDDPETPRPDLIYYLVYTVMDLPDSLDGVFKEYHQRITKRYGQRNKDEMRKIFDNYIKLFEEILKHTTIEFQIDHERAY